MCSDLQTGGVPSMMAMTIVMLVVSITGSIRAVAVATLMTRTILAKGVCIIVVKNADTLMTLNVRAESRVLGNIVPILSVVRILIRVFMSSSGVNSLLGAFVEQDSGLRNYSMTSSSVTADIESLLMRIVLAVSLLSLMILGVSRLTMLMKLFMTVVPILGGYCCKVPTRLSTVSMSWPQVTLSRLSSILRVVHGRRRYSGVGLTLGIGNMG